MYWMDAAGLYTPEPPTRKLQKAPEINTLTALPTFVISRSGVRIRPPAPTQLNMGEFQSGRMGQTVNLLAMPSVVRIHLPPPNKRDIHADVSFIWRENRGGFEPRALRNVPGGKAPCRCWRQIKAWRFFRSRSFCKAMRMQTCKS